MFALTGRVVGDDRLAAAAPEPSPQGIAVVERMYKLEGGEISFKLKTMATCFLETSTGGREWVFQAVKKLYDIRSAIVHKRKIPPSAEEKNEAFSKGFEVARRSVVKLLRDGPPPDWNKVVIAGIEPSASKPRASDETT